MVDEEQHFGVGHKERLKELRAEVHMLTLSATPIPRTLQLAMTGVREMSIIATPPVDRLAVRTFVSPFDALIVREALLRERYRGGQSFYVCPRIEDLDEAAAFLRQNVPETKFVIAHGQMAATELEDKIGAFYDGKYDILLSTAIVELGLDIPRANTLIVHRADMFGLGAALSTARPGRAVEGARLRDLHDARRGRRSRRRRRSGSPCCSRSTRSAPASSSPRTTSTCAAPATSWARSSPATSRRSATNSTSRWCARRSSASSRARTPAEDLWSPTIQLGAPVTIPESYIPDLPTRLSLYRRLSALEDEAEIDAMGAEIVDRFGPPPPEVGLLMKLVLIKALCRRANVEKLDAGAEGRDAGLPRQRLRQPDRPREMGDRARLARPRAAGHADRGGGRFREARGPAGRGR